MVKNVDSQGYTPNGLVLDINPEFCLEAPSLADLFLFGVGAETPDELAQRSYDLNRMIVDFFDGQEHEDTLGDAVAEIAGIDPYEWAYIEFEG